MKRRTEPHQTVEQRGGEGRAAAQSPASAALEGVAENEILVYGNIGEDFWDPDAGVTGAKVAARLRAIPRTASEVVVRINSYGGDAFEGIAIHNLLRSDARRIVVKIDGAAISAASIIAMAGNEVRIAENAMLMIHDPWSWTAGNAAEMRAKADSLDKIAEAICTSYVSKTGKPTGECRQLMAAETWMTAAEALEMGFVDAVDRRERDQEGDDSAAAADGARIVALDRYRNVPEWARRAATANQQTRIAALAPKRAAVDWHSSVAAIDAIKATLAKINPPATSAAVTQEDQDMSDQEHAAAPAKAAEETGAVKAQLADMAAARDAEKTRADKAETERAALAQQNEKLVAERDAAVKDAAALRDQQLVAEVDALIGVKIDPCEREEQLELARANKSLFDRLIKQRAPKTTLQADPAKMGPDPKPEPLGAGAHETGAGLAALIRRAADAG